MTYLSPEKMVQAYANGYFPMADPDEDDQIYWYLPEERALMPIQTFHVSRRLAKTIRQGVFSIRKDTDFEQVVRLCADREDTWLSEEIIDVFLALFNLGFAHSVGAYKDGKLVGGVYGMAIGRAFFAESMFHRERDASKVALAGLVDWLANSGFTVMDVQFMNDHLKQFGAYEVDGEEYDRLLQEALLSDAASA